jgi:energy-coupling factor transport system substrate-specific component
MLGALMFVSKMALEWLPSVHLLALFISAATLSFKLKALMPLYVYILTDGAIHGFALWWVPYLYIFLPLWGGIMLVSRIKNNEIKAVCVCAVCGLNGLAFGTLYAPCQALFYGLSFKGTITWIVAGLGFDTIHGISNAAVSTFALPLAALLNKLNAAQHNLQ